MVTVVQELPMPSRATGCARDPGVVADRARRLMDGATVPGVRRDQAAATQPSCQRFHATAGSSARRAVFVLDAVEGAHAVGEVGGGQQVGGVGQFVDRADQGELVELVSVTDRRQASVKRLAPRTRNGRL